MTSTATADSRLKKLDVSKLLVEGRAFLALAVIIVVFTILSPNYLTVNNVLIMSSHVAIFALLSLGMLMVVLTGGIDLSVGSTLGFSAVVGGYLLKGVPIAMFGVTLYPSVPVAVLISVAVGGLIGLINGVLVARFNVAPFVATLGMLYVVRGAALLMTDGLTVNGIQGDPALGNTGFEWLGFNRILGIPVGVIIMAVVALGIALLLSRTTFGLSGVPVRTVKVWVYVISGLCSAIAGLVLASTLTSASPNAGNTYELTAIAAVVIGGAVLSGGRGNVRGTLLGAFVIGFLSDGLVIVGMSEYWQTVFVGAVIVVAVLLNNLQYGGRGRRGAKKTASKPETKTVPAAGDVDANGAGIDEADSAAGREDPDPGTSRRTADAGPGPSPDAPSHRDGGTSGPPDASRDEDTTS